MATPARMITRPTIIRPAGGHKELAKEPRPWRAVRIAIAIPLLAISIGAFFPLAVIPVSSQAVVNARLARVRAGYSGEVIDAVLETGDLLNINQNLVRIRLTPNAAAPSNLEPSRNRRDLEAQLSQIEAELSAQEQEVDHYRQEQSDYSARFAAEIELQLKKAEHGRESAQQAVGRANAELKRDEEAVQDHIITRAVLEEAREKAERAQAELDSTTDTEEKLRKEVADVKAGFYLSGLVEQPRYLPLLEQAQSAVLNLKSHKQALEAQALSLDNAIAMERNHLQDVITVRSPVAGIVWSRGAAVGQAVNEGDDLFRIADAASIHVDVWLDRRYGPQLSLGDIALIELSGLGKELSGRVTAFQGTSRRRLDEEVNAIDLQPVHPDQYRVTIELDPADRKANYIGQAAKVLFPGSRARFKTKLYSWLARL